MDNVCAMYVALCAMYVALCAIYQSNLSNKQSRQEKTWGLIHKENLQQFLS